MMKFARARNRGFSLTELAIVLGIAGAILSMVWVAISRSSHFLKQQQALNAIVATVSGMRNFYASQAGIPSNMTYQQLSSNMIALGVVPAQLNRNDTSSCSNPAPQSGGSSGLCADTPWGLSQNKTDNAGGTFRVCGWQWVSGLGAAAQQAGCAATPAAMTGFFGVGLVGLSQGDCIGLMENISGPQGAPGLMDININGTDIVESLQLSITPVDPHTATTYCQKSANGSDNLVFVYRLGGG